MAIYHAAYNERGALEAEDLLMRATRTTARHDRHAARRMAIEEIRYNAKGQKEYLELGNGTITTYGYDPKTFRLTTLKTRRRAPASASR